MATESPLLTVPLPVPPANGVTSVLVSEEPTPKRSWFSTNLRNMITVAMTVMVCWLAYEGEQTARAALIATFTVLAGAIWGERSALKVPGKDN